LRAIRNSGERRHNITPVLGRAASVETGISHLVKSTARYKFPSRLAGGASATRIGRVVDKKIGKAEQ
jgi:hypothetical protein